MMKLRLGIIGISDGNGHPYSWSAIFNGFNSIFMKDCPYNVIPEYLSKQKYPDDFLSDYGRVTHVWTQDKAQTDHIARASNIPSACSHIEEMIDNVDAVLLARDDYDTHYSLALPIIKKGLPIFIDKPLTLNIDDAKRLFDEQLYENQIFTCSSLRFAKEFSLTPEDKLQIGKIGYIFGTTPKNWDKYGIHVLEPIIAIASERGKLLSVKTEKKDLIHAVNIKWENVNALILSTGKSAVPMQINLYGSNTSRELVFRDTFFAFKESLKFFIRLIYKETENIPQEQTLEIINILQQGNG